MNQFGSKGCINNLKQELQILQSCSTFFTHHVAPNDCYSWKFPKTLALDVNLEDMLTRIVHDKSNIKKNQMFHLLLLELIIDRLLLILHMISLWMLSCTDLKGQIIELESKLSVEMQCKQLTAIVDAFEGFSEGATSLMPASESDELQIVVQRKTTEAEITHQTLAWLHTLEEEYTKKIEKVSTDGSRHEEKRTSEQSIQTDDCNLEYREQEAQFEKMRYLLESSFTCVINLCSSCNLPSEIGSKLNENHASPLNGPRNSAFCEPQKASSAVQKDCERVNNYLKQMREQIPQLEREKMELQGELETASERLQEREIELNTMKENFKVQQEQLTKEKDTLDGAITNLKVELTEYQDSCKRFEKTIHELRQKLCECEGDTNSLTKVLQEKTTLLRGQNTEILALENAARELQKQLSVEQTRNETMLDENRRVLLEKTNMELQLNNLRQKHQALSERVNVLMTEKAQHESMKNEYQEFVHELQETLKLTETDKAKLALTCQQQESKLFELQEMHEQSLSRITELTKDIDDLRVKLMDQENKIQVLIQFPDLDVPAPTVHPAPIRSVQEEIDGQIQANELRITALQEQTKRLQNARHKILEVRSPAKTDEQTNASSELTSRIDRFPILPSDWSRSGSAVSHKSSLMKEPAGKPLELLPVLKPKRTEAPRSMFPPLELWSGPIRSHNPNRRRR